VTGAKIESNHTAVSLPYQDTDTYQINGMMNTSIYINCSLGTCPFSSPLSLNLSFFNTTKKNLTFNITIPKGTPNGYSKEVYKLYNNGSVIPNISIEFNFNVSVPGKKANFTLKTFSPANDSYFGQFDPLPTAITIGYTGEINFSRSSIRLYHNNSLVNWWTLNKTNKSFTLNLQKSYDGLYEGRFSLNDSKGGGRIVYYRFQINQKSPSAPKAISPNKGQYKDEVHDLIVTMDSGNYTISYLINDGFPVIGSNKWATMSYINGQYQVSDFDFGDASIGQIYVKVKDLFGNIAVYPTGIISMPSMSVDVESVTRLVRPGEEFSLDTQVRLKKDTGTKFRCRMSDFIANEDDDDEVIWASQSNAQLVFTNDDDEVMELSKDYGDTLTIAQGVTSKSLDLTINIPLSVVQEDYESNLECIIV